MILKRKPKTGTIVFYSLYFLGVALALTGIFALMSPLNGWLETYQASQPENMSRQIYQELFADPDWEALYHIAQVEDTAFEGAAAYGAYMEATVGSDSLMCMETSAGLSGDKKYILRHGNEKVASFTMTGTEDEKTRITTWELGTVELFFQRKISVTVDAAADQTVYINGIPLDDSHTVRLTTTRAEEYLPEGVHGLRRKVQTVDGLLAQPEITVLNADGTQAQVTQENSIYTAASSLSQITDREEKLALGAAKAKALYSIRAVGGPELRKYFDKDSQLYKDIYSTMVFMQDYTGYRFDESITSVTDFYRYNDDLFSAYVTLRLLVSRENGPAKVYDVGTTFLFARHADGQFLVSDMTNLSMQEPVEQVRLTLMGDDPTFFMVDAQAKVISLPAPQAPAGQVFQGWAVQDADESGRIVMTIRFIPDENGNVYPSEKLEPMVLYPIFQAA
jgi:hypothetical protein